MTKLVVVVGITGGQGRSVMKALLSNPSYKLRGTTRDTTSENAKALAAKGVEVVPADFNDEESLVRAFQVSLTTKQQYFHLNHTHQSNPSYLCE